MATRKKATAKKSESHSQPGKALSEVEAQEKLEVQNREEQAHPGRYYVPHADIFESSDSLYVVLEMPGVGKDSIDVQLDKNVLSVEGRIDFSNYENLRPVYTEYNIGHFSRRFRVPNTVDSDHIKASLEDGVLTLELEKVNREKTKRIKVE